MHNLAVARVGENVQRVIHGQHETVEMLLICLLAEGHMLLEDVPGVGKTSLARALAASLGGTSKRVQFTPDLLPADVTGTPIYNQKTRDFEFREGPVFANVVIADEINRASPKTQSAMLEVMDERNVTADGKTHAVPRPFVVVATQNPVEMEGLYKLPEAQLDRFLMCVSMGYPDYESEIAVLSTHSATSASPIDDLRAVATAESILEASRLSDAVHVARPVMDYVVSIARATRENPDVRLGVSPRGTLAMVRAARARAFLHDRDYVSADDVKSLASVVFRHRILLTAPAKLQGLVPELVLAETIESVPTPEGVAA